MYCWKFLIPIKKRGLTSAGIELESPRLLVCSANHSAIRTCFSKILKIFILNILALMVVMFSYILACFKLEMDKNRCTVVWSVANQAVQ